MSGIIFKNHIFFMTDMNTPNFQIIFESLGSNYLILDATAPKFTIVAVANGYLAATLTERKDLVGVDLFKAFPDNPADEHATGERNLSASLNRVLELKKPDHMPIQKYDIPISRTEDLGFEERYWLPVNAPIFDESGNITYIAHFVTDVTEHEHLIMLYGGGNGTHPSKGTEGLTQIDRLNKIMVDRELRMVELKKQLAECKAEKGK